MIASALSVALLSIFFAIPALAEETCAVSGVVVHAATEEPVAGVRLCLGQGVYQGKKRAERVVPYGDPPSRFETTSDAEGAFRIEGISPGKRLLMTCDPVMAAAKDYILLDLEPGQKVAGITIQVAEGASLTGVVLDEAYEHPIEGAAIEASTHETRVAYDPPYDRTYRATTDADGRFRLGALPQGEYTVSSTPDDGFREKSGDVTSLGRSLGMGIPLRWDQHVEDLRVAVVPYRVVSGTVRDEGGAPVPGAYVGYIGCWEPDWNAMTDADGRFQLGETWGEDGQFTVLAKLDDRISAPTPWPVNDSENVELVLRPEASIAGQVVKADGTALRDAGFLEVELEFTEDSCYGGKDPAVNADGTFAFPGLTPGTYAIEVRDQNDFDSKSETVTVTIGPGESKRDVQVVYDKAEREPEPGATIAGRVLNWDSSPVAEAQVDLLAFESSATVSGADGTFLIHTGLNEETASLALAFNGPEKTVTLFASKKDCGFARTDSAHLGAKDVEIRFEKGMSVELTALDAETNTPVERFGLRMLANIPNILVIDHNEEEMLQEPIQDRPAGHYEVHRLQAFEYVFEVDAPGYLPGRESVDAKQGTGQATVEVRLTPAVTLRGRVRDPEGRPVRFAWVSASPPGADSNLPATYALSTQQRSRRCSTETDGTGAFVLSPVVKEPLEVQVTSRVFPEYTVPVAPGADGFAPVDIRLSSGGAVRVRVTEGGQPISGVDISVFPQPNGPAGYAPSRTDEEGYCTIQSLPAGPTTVHASYMENSGQQYGRDLSADAVITEGSTAEVDIDFLPGICNLEGTVTWNGEPEQARVTVVSLLPAGQTEWEVIPTSSDGRFVVRHLPDVPTRVHAGSERGTKVQVVSLFPHDTEEVNLELASGVTLAGKVEGIDVSPHMILALLDGEHEDVNRKPGEIFVGASYSLGSTRLKTPDFEFERVQPGRVTLLLRRAARNTPGRPHTLHRWILDVGEEDQRGLVLTVPAE